MTEHIKKKLIEVALPLDAINAASERENYIYKANPSSVHKWWAQRPLAACRAVLFSQLVDDPSAHPDEFPTEETQDAERSRLFSIIEQLVKWENSTNEKVLDAARAEIQKSYSGNPPPILDPFAGGGSIPLEAQRLGLRAVASDLNPVAVLINKALIELPPRWSNNAPVFPHAAAERSQWIGAEGLADDVRRYGAWMRDEAEQRIGHLYPKAILDDNSSANAIAWIWARTVTCPNPACGATMPLVRSFWLSKKKGKTAWAKPLVNGTRVSFEIADSEAGPEVDGTVGRSGATCLCCDSAVQLEHIRVEARAGRMGAQLMAVVAEGSRKRVYLSPNPQHVAAANLDRPESTPISDLPDKALGFRVQAYGMRQHADLFTNRQLVALTTFSDLVGEARVQAESDAKEAGRDEETSRSYAADVATYLALGVSKYSDYGCSLAVWYPKEDRAKNLFARHAIPMVWDYPEVNPMAQIGGGLLRCIEIVSESIVGLRSQSAGVADLGDARTISSSSPVVVSTDPPYYDNIGYADLSDFFYVWLRRSLRDVHPELFGTMVTPKSSELISTPFRHESKAAGDAFFEAGFVETFGNLLEISVPSAPMTVFYAFKQTDDKDGDGLGSTGWSTMLEGLLAAGWMVTATWPLRTERGSRSIAIGNNALASSVVLSCRMRPAAAGITDRQGLIRALQDELPRPLRELQKASIAPVDLRQAAIGPGMAVFSRFAKVVESDSEPMRVRTALALINQVLDGILSEQEADFDTETRWAIQWFQQFYFDEGAYGVAEQLATAMNVSIAEMERSGILVSGNGKVRLLGRDEYAPDWDPRKDTRTPIWEATQHLVKRLEDDGELASAKLLELLGGVGESCRALAYRLYTICETTRPNLAGPFNALAASWTEMQRIATDDKRRMAEPGEQQSFDVG